MPRPAVRSNVSATIIVVGRKVHPILPHHALSNTIRELADANNSEGEQLALRFTIRLLSDYGQTIVELLSGYSQSILELLLDYC